MNGQQKPWWADLAGCLIILVIITVITVVFLSILTTGHAWH